jgi:hypothetical protein
LRRLLLLRPRRLVRRAGLRPHRSGTEQQHRVQRRSQEPRKPGHASNSSLAKMNNSGHGANSGAPAMNSL